MSTPKRKVSALEDHVTSPNKLAKLSTYDSEQLMSMAKELQSLKYHVAELYEFIDASGISLSAPTSIRIGMRSRKGATKILATQIYRSMLRIYEDLYDDTSNARKTGISSDDLSAAMMPFFDEIETLRELPGSTVLAYDMARELADFSYGELDSGGCGYGSRPSDMEVDMLLEELAIERKLEDPEWDFIPHLEALKQQAENLAEYGIDDFWSQSIKLMSAWADGVSESESLSPIA